MRGKKYFLLEILGLEVMADCSRAAVHIQRARGRDLQIV